MEEEERPSSPPQVDDPDVYPADFQPPRRANGSSGSSDLIVAAGKGRAHPGHWVKVGQPRALVKPPHNWVSEVRLNQKKELLTSGETWEADFDVTGEDEDGLKIYQKRIKLVVS